MIRLERRVWQRICLCALCASAIGVVGLCAWPYTVDDAYIVARYAVRISQSLGYTFNPGVATDGVTGPVWLLPGFVAARAGGDPIAAAKFAGLVCVMVAAAWCVGEQRGARTAVLTLLLVTAEPSLGGLGGAGLETGAATLMVTLAVSAALARPRPKPAAVGGAIACLAWLRPELALLSALLLVIVTLRAGARRAWPAWLLAGAGALGVCAFRLHLSGTWLPLAWDAKAGTLADGASYAVRAVLVSTGGLGLALCVAGARWGGGRERARAGCLIVHTLSVILAGGDWMPGFRLFVPLLPQYAQLAAVGAERTCARGRAGAVCSVLMLLCALGVPLLDLALRIPEWRATGASREGVGRAIADELRANSRRVALVDIGFLGYASGCEVVDLAGITDPEVAALPGGHLDKHVSSAWLEARAPDTFLLHSSSQPLAAHDGQLLSLRGYPVERRVARAAWFRNSFRVVATYAYAPGYTYVLLRRAASPRQ
jgi:hypothetical protein